MRTPDLTPCFQDMVVMVIPSVFLLLASIVRLPLLLQRSPHSHDTRHWLYFMKLTFLIALLLTKGTSLVLAAIYAEWHLQSVTILSLATNVVAVILAMTLHHLEYTRNRTTSGTLSCYWILVFIAHAIKLRTMVLLQHSSTTDIYPGNLGLYCISYTLSTCMLILECTMNPRKIQFSKDTNEEQECPELTTPMFGRLLFSWMTPFMKWGSHQFLSFDDLWSMDRNLCTTTVTEVFQSHWNSQKRTNSPSLSLALFSMLEGSFYFSGLLKLLHDTLQFMQPILLRQFMEWAASYTASRNPGLSSIGVLLAVGMFVIDLCQSLVIHQYLQLCHINDRRLSSVLITSMCQKILLLSSPDRQKTPMDEIQQLKGTSASIHNLWSGPIQFFVAVVFLYSLLGMSTYAGVSTLVVFGVLNSVIQSQLQYYKALQKEKSTERVQWMDTIVKRIRVIKMNVWETLYIDKVDTLYLTKELPLLKKMGLLRVVRDFSLRASPLIASITTFGVYSQLSTPPLTATTAFMSLLLFAILESSLSQCLDSIDSLKKKKKNIQSVSNFLTLKEQDPKTLHYKDFRLLSYWTPDIPLISITNGSFCWEPNGSPVLDAIHFEVKKGSLVGITGCKDSGKSTLLSTLLGETFRLSGQAVVRGSIAYVSPQPWIPETTLREAIIFGHRWDKSFYDLVLSVCHLQSDITDLPEGDSTIIMGDHPLLTASQKARIALARALYARADIYLLDTPFQNIEPATRTSIMDKVIGPNGLLKNKARVLVSDNIGDLQKVNRIILLEKGRVALDGGFEAWIQQRSGLQMMSGPLQDEPPSPVAVGSSSHWNRQQRLRENSGQSIKTLKRASMALSLFGSTRVPVQYSKSVGAVPVTKESVRVEVLKPYLRSLSIWGLLCVLLMLMGSQGLQVISNLWLHYWIEHQEESIETLGDSVYVYIGIYAVIGILSALFAMLQSFVFWVLCVGRTAKTMHTKILHSVIKSPLSFFAIANKDIVDQLDKDQAIVNDTLPHVLYTLLSTLASVLSTCIIITLSTPFFLLMVIPLSLVFMNLQQTYSSVSQNMRQLLSLHKDKLTAHIKDMRLGATTICSYQQQPRFLVICEEMLDSYQAIDHIVLSCQQWMAVRSDIMGSAAVLGASGLAVVGILYSSGHFTNPGLLGLGLVYALTVSQSLHTIAFAFTRSEVCLSSAGRLQKYVDLQSENFESLRRVHPLWPTKGAIEFRGYSAHPHPGIDYPLHEVSFDVAPGEKIGVIGESKSTTASLSLCLLRMIEQSQGHILIDGVDICSLRLSDLRSRLAVIPSEPVLFSDTIRSHLDPFDTYEDIQLWRVLQAVGMDEVIAKLEGQLSCVILEKETTFSIGQKQMIYLARALLSRSTVLIWEEAIDLPDVELEALQEIIQREFKHCTVLTIAQTLNTVMSSDKILVLEEGCLVEYSTPQKLLMNRNSIFYSLVQQAILQ
ncbi:multi drug resistance-associated protein MRP [Spinellus fusiger]|nr:multi drug resistance-associated protein MRP [Spinellus fusiger]